LFGRKHYGSDWALDEVETSAPVAPAATDIRPPQPAAPADAVAEAEATALKPPRPHHHAAAPAPVHHAPPHTHAAPAAKVAPAAKAAPAEPKQPDVGQAETYDHIRQLLFSRINVSAAVMTGRDRLRRDVEQVVGDIVATDRLKVTAAEQTVIVDDLLNDMFGVGPIECLIEDDTITDIMVNGPNQVYIERHGRLELTNVRFRDNNHVLNVAQRIASSVGRRVDETSPMVDARLADGSRVNVILPPLAVKGPCLSIRKFSRNKPTIAKMVQQGNLSPAMGRVLEIAAASRLNIVISGGTGSGKTTLMNAMSRVIDHRERIVTIEDACELQLQQPHVVSLETRPLNSEGLGEVNQRDLLRNALRMRPDRIILGETRGSEAFDVLQAMNTGHDGSMTTVHANTPRDAVTRLENMVLMGAVAQPLISIRRQIVGAVNLVVQLERMRDGRRRVTQVTEVVGMEGDVIITQDLFIFDYDPSQFGDEVKGTYRCTGIRPCFMERARYYGLDQPLQEAMTI